MTRRKTADLQVGEVVRYPYLWRREGQRGETEGRKARPVCVAMHFPWQGRSLVIFLPITSTEPFADQGAIEIPATELRRVGLDSARRGWIILSEGNIDDLDRSFHYDRSQPTLGRFGKSYMVEVLKRLQPYLKERKMMTDRR